MSKRVTDPTLAAQLERQTYSVMEVAKILGIGRLTAYEQVKAGTIPSIQVGKRRLVPRKMLERYLDGRDA